MGQEMPKPGAYQSCEAGFLAAHNAVSKFHSDKQAEWEKKRAAGETPEQAEKEMEEEAIIEEKIVAEVPKGAPIDEKKIHEKVQQIESELKKHENQPNQCLTSRSLVLLQELPSRPRCP